MNLKLSQVLFYLLFVLLQTLAFGENPDSTLSKIKTNSRFIKKASEIFNVNSKILSSIIFVERKENYTWEDDAMDEYLAQVGLNSSIGFCQVKLKTAYWIEVQLNETNSLHFPGFIYYKLLSLSETPNEIITKLQNDSLNIMYAAAYLRIMISRWEKENYPINDRPEILGTLYSTGLFYGNGNERIPNKNPKRNNFGKMVLESITYFDDI